ncbi:MAG: competence/damage-inducible protein A [Candidatus Eisenbacteria bacterium]
MKVEVITVGTEIVSGGILDTNFRFLARKLGSIGARVLWHTSVGDDPETMADAVRTSLRRADTVVVTGGLGPTPDDITRKVVAGVLGRTLLLDDAVLDGIRARFRARGMEMPSINETQALFPKGAEVLPNKVGTAPGFFMIEGAKLIFVLPGVPIEAEAMVDEELIPRLSDRAPAECGEQLVLRTTGVAESIVAERIASLEEPLEVASISYLPNEYGVDLCLTFRPGDEKQVQAVRRRVRERLLEMLGERCYAEGERKLEEVVGELLVARNHTLGVAESVTGGAVSRLITSVPGASRYFLLGVTAYGNEAKADLLGVPRELIEIRGAVSAEVAISMAKGVREKARADVGLSTTGIAGPTGGSAGKPVGLVYVGAAFEGGTDVKELRLGGNRELIIRRASVAALDFLRKYLTQRERRPPGE